MSPQPVDDKLLQAAYADETDYQELADKLADEIFHWTGVQKEMTDSIANVTERLKANQKVVALADGVLAGLVIHATSARARSDKQAAIANISRCEDAMTGYQERLDTANRALADLAKRKAKFPHAKWKAQKQVQAIMAAAARPKVY